MGPFFLAGETNVAKNVSALVRSSSEWGKDEMSSTLKRVCILAGSGGFKISFLRKWRRGFPWGMSKQTPKRKKNLQKTCTGLVPKSEKKSTWKGPPALRCQAEKNICPHIVPRVAKKNQSMSSSESAPTHWWDPCHWDSGSAVCWQRTFDWRILVWKSSSVTVHLLSPNLEIYPSSSPFLGFSDLSKNMQNNACVSWWIWCL